MIGYTTIEQSKKLVELGIDVDSADMYHSIVPEVLKKENGNLSHNIGVIQTVHNVTFSDIKRTLENVYDKYKEVQLIPCWSTEALIKLLPREIHRTDNYILNNISVYPNKGYCVSYRNLSNYEYKELIMYVSDTLLECAFEMIVKLKETKLI